MTGVINNNLIRNDIDGEIHNVINNGQNQPLVHANPENQNIQNLEIVVGEENIAQHLPVEVIAKYQKLSDFVARNPRATVDQVLKKITDMASTGENGTRTLFSSAREVQGIDVFLNRSLQTLIGHLCAWANPPVNQQNLIEDLKQAMNRIMCPPEYNQAQVDRAEGKRQLLIQAANSLLQAAGADTDAGRAVSQIRDFYSRVLDNQMRIFRSLQDNKGLKNPVTAGSPKDALGIGKVLPNDIETFKKEFTAPQVSPDDVKSEVLSGNMTMTEALSRHPEYESILRELSEGKLNELSANLSNMTDLRNDHDGDMNELVHIQVGGINDDTAKQLVSKVMNNLKLISQATGKADTLLSAEDRDEFIRKFATAPGNNANPEVPNPSRDLFRENMSFIRDTFFRTALYQEQNPGNANLLNDTLSRLMGNPAQCMKLLSAIDYSEDIFREMLRNPVILKSYTDIVQGAVHGDELRTALQNISQGLRNPVFRGDNSLLQSLLKTVPAAVYANNAADRAILEHYPVTLDLTQDALACINHVLRGAPGANQQDKTAAEIDLYDLRNAYQALCHPTRQLESYIKGLGDHQDIRNQEALVLKAAFHRYLAENPNILYDQNGVPQNVSFRECQGFLGFMGIVSEDNHHPGPNEVSLSRYGEADPTTANIKETDAGFFIGVFNVMMNNASFLKAAAKLPEVHLVRKMSEALNVNIEKLLEQNPALRASYDNACREKGGIVNWFKANQGGFLDAFLTENMKTSLSNRRNENNEDLNTRKNRIAEAGLKALSEYKGFYSKSGTAAPGNAAPGALPASISTVEGVLRETAAVRGSEKLGLLAASLAAVCPPDIEELIPAGTNYLNLTAQAFRNPDQLNAIRDALNAASDEEKQTPKYADVFMSYVRLKVYCEQHQNQHEPVAAQDLAAVRVTAQNLAFVDENLPQPQAGDFVVLGEIHSPLYNALKRRLAPSREALTAFLKELKVTDDMFAPEHNIFVSNKESGKAKCQAVKNAIKSALESLARPNADVSGVARELFGRIKNELAGNKTRELAAALMTLSPYLTKTFHPDSVKAQDQAHDIMTRNIKGLFKADYVKGSQNLLAGVLANITSSYGVMADQMRGDLTELKRVHESQITGIQGIFNNSAYGRIMLENAVHKAAYDNGYKTLADMKYAIIKGKAPAGKTPADLVNDAVAYLKTRFQTAGDQRLRAVPQNQREAEEAAINSLCNEEALRKLVQSHLSLDDNSENVGNSIHTARIKYAFRVVKNSSPVKAIKGFFSAIPGVGRLAAFFKNRNQLSKGRDYAESILNSIPPGQTLTHYHDNKLTGGFGIKFKAFGAGFKAQAELSLDGNADFKVSHTKDGKFVFTLGAALAADLKGTAAFKEAKTDVVSASVGVGGGYKKVYILTFNDREKAREFLARAATNNLDKKTMGSANSQVTQSVKNIHGGAEIKADIYGVFQEIKGDDVSAVREPANAQASVGAQGDYTRSYERGSDYHRYSTHTKTTLYAGAKATFSLQQTLLGNKDPTKMTPEEMEEYNKIDANLTTGDMIIAGFLNHNKYMADYVIGKYGTSQFNTNAEYLKNDENHQSAKTGKKRWMALDDLTKYKEDPSRYIAESVANILKKEAINPAVKDVDSLADWLLSKIPGWKQMKDFRKFLDNFLGAHGDTSKVRTSAGFSLGDSTNNLVQFHAEVSYTVDNETRYDTNLIENSLRRADKITRVAAESSGSPAAQMQKNLEFLRTSLKEMGCSEDEIAKAVARLHNMQSKGIKISGFEINRTAKKGAISRINQELADRNPADNFKAEVNKLKDSDFKLDSIVFNVASAHYNEVDNFNVSFIASLDHTVTNKQTMVKNQVLKF
jgi:hypothetical protein